jgi:hypothetical protein
VRVASAEAPDGNDLHVQVKKSDTLCELIRLQGAGQLKSVDPILHTIASLCAVHLDDPRQTVDVNLMIPLADKLANRAACLSNTDARKAFGVDLFDSADVVLRVQNTTNQTYNGFWVPVFRQVSGYMPGAALTYGTLQPKVVFTRFVEREHFGNGRTKDEVDAILNYLSNVPFQTFLSLPVLSGSQISGVVNVNLEHDEIKLMDPDEQLRLYHALRPFLSAIDAVVLQGGSAIWRDDAASVSHDIVS